MGFRIVLGINWNIGKDLFVFDFGEINQLRGNIIEQNLLKISATFFDP